MELLQGIQAYAQSIPAELKEKNGIQELSFTVAERKTFLSRQKLTYQAKFRIDEVNKAVKFTEMLKEGSAGLQAGAGFQVESYNTFKGGKREETIKQQSELFGKKYSYTFDFKTIRNKIEVLAIETGYVFEYQITSLGL